VELNSGELPAKILPAWGRRTGQPGFFIANCQLKIDNPRVPAPPATFRNTTVGQRRTLVAAALGWMLDAFDTMLYALVLAHIMHDLGMSKATSGFLATLTLLASGIGGVLFGFIADRIGRKRALMLSILTYSLCSFASGLAISIAMLAVFRFILGLAWVASGTPGQLWWRRLGRPNYEPRRSPSCRVPGRSAMRSPPWSQVSCCTTQTGGWSSSSASCLR